MLSRRGTTLNKALPDIVTAAGKRLPAGTIADGEIVRWSSTGQPDFEALQRRNRSAGRGAHNEFTGDKITVNALVALHHPAGGPLLLFVPSEP